MTAVTMSPEAARLMLDSGTGWVTVDEVPRVGCPRCKGIGVADDGPGDGPCRSCLGSGEDIRGRADAGFRCDACGGDGREQRDPRQECTTCEMTGTVSIVGQRVEVMTASTREFSASLTERTAAAALVAEPLPILDECTWDCAHICRCYGDGFVTWHTVLPNPRPGPSETDITRWADLADWSPGRTALRLKVTPA